MFAYSNTAYRDCLPYVLARMLITMATQSPTKSEWGFEDTSRLLNYSCQSYADTPDQSKKKGKWFFITEGLQS